VNIHATLERLIHLEERVGHLYIRFYKRFAHLPGVADLWWEMALEEHGHAGILKMVKALTAPTDRGRDVRGRLRPLESLIRGCERDAKRVTGLKEALGIAVRLERSELDRLGRETMRGIARDLPVVPRSAFAPHEAHLDRLTRTVRKFGGEEVLREAWALSSEARGRRTGEVPSASEPSGRSRALRGAERRDTSAENRGLGEGAKASRVTARRRSGVAGRRAP
jgi:hypothetical protein